MQPDFDQLYNKAQTHLLESAEIKRRIAEKCMVSILSAVNLIVATFEKEGKVLLCGNGGSAADCQHMAAEFVNCLTKDFKRPGLPAIALTTDTSFLTAYANDYGYNGVFERQVQTLGKHGDCLIGISTSGNSSNVMQAVRVSQSIDLHTIVLTGADGSLAAMADVVIAIPSSNTQYIQEAHLTVEHIVCEMVERKLFQK